jgi:hypothetical protein
MRPSQLVGYPVHEDHRWVISGALVQGMEAWVHSSKFLPTRYTETPDLLVLMEAYPC